MIIVVGNELVDALERDTYVAAHRDLVSRAREFDGCIHVATRPTLWMPNGSTPLRCGETPK